MNSKEEYGFDKDKYDDSVNGLNLFKIICVSNKFTLNE